MWPGHVHIQYYASVFCLAYVILLYSGWVRMDTVSFTVGLGHPELNERLNARSSSKLQLS